MDPVLKVVHIEDSYQDAELIAHALKLAGLRFSVVRVDGEPQIVDVLRAEQPDIILSDFSLPQFDGMAVLKLALASTPEVPFIFVSGTIGEERAIEVMKLGATDYVLKSNLSRLGPVIRRALQEASERQAKQRLEQQLHDIIETSQDWIWEIDASGRYTFCSPGVREILGQEPDYLLGQSYLSGLHAEDRPQFDAAWRKLGPDNRRLCAWVGRWQHRDGSWRWLERNALALYADDGQWLGVRGTDRDVTERKRQDQRIARLNRVQVMLSSINAIVFRSRTREELLQEALRVAIDTGGYACACILLADAAHGTVRPLVWKGQNYNPFVDQGGRRLADQAVRTCQPAIAPDQAIVALPLLIDSTTIATLNLSARERGTFTGEELSLLREVAGSLAFALQYLQKEDAVQFLAYFDPLTSLARRALFCERIDRLLAQADGPAQSTTLLVLDVERLSGVNDRFGRNTGDKLLQLIAEQLKGDIDATQLAHLGAGTFGIILSDIGNSEQALHGARERIARLFDHPFTLGGQAVRVSMRSGIARCPRDGATADALLQNAEMALARAKASGEKYLHFIKDMNVEFLERLSLEQKLRQAIEERHYVLYYQPKVAVATGRIVGMEALLRWNDPNEGLVPAARFIPVLEDSGLIVDVGKWVLEQALADGARWHAAGFAPVPIAVNVSNHQLRKRDFAETVLRIVANCPYWPIDVEITESALMADLVGGARKLNRLREAGVGIAIDDFGTGYSSLRQLSRLAVDSLKIDRSFIVGLANDPADMTIVSTIISLARAFDLTTVAEGVETHEQLKLLRLLKCHQIQGYLIAKPMPADALGSLLSKSGRLIDVDKPDTATAHSGRAAMSGSVK